MLYLVPEPKSPHGVDVTPDGKYIVVAGKLDPHVTVYSFERSRRRSTGRSVEGRVRRADPRFEAVIEAQVELGLGPLHTQFDDKGYAYTRLFLDSAVARWKWAARASTAAGSSIDKIPVALQHRPPRRGRGRHGQPRRQVPGRDEQVVGRPLLAGRPAAAAELPARSTSRAGDKMQLLYDMPIGIGEPHYAQMIKADKLKPWRSTRRSAGTRSPQARIADRGRRRQGAHREARRQQGRRLHDRRSAATSRPDIVEVKRATR